MDEHSIQVVLNLNKCSCGETWSPDLVCPALPARQQGMVYTAGTHCRRKGVELACIWVKEGSCPHWDPRHPGHLPMFVGLHPTMPDPRVGTLVLQQPWQQLLEEMGGELATEWGEGWAPRVLSPLWEGNPKSG